MRQMSFALTTTQVKQRAKDVTRRLGWSTLKPGERIQAIVKGQGLKKGEHPVKLCVIEIVSVKPEPLIRMLQWKRYGFTEVRREGFPNMTPREFVDFFCKANKCERTQVVNRIEFKYVSWISYTNSKPD